MEKLSLSIAVALAAGVAFAGLEPMLDAETIVPNGGTIRFFKGANWRGRGARLVIVDTKGIEHPLCLSNFGRRAGDGSYPLE